MDMEKLKGREVQKHAFSGAAQICKKKTENTLSSEETGLCSPDEQAGESFGKSMFLCFSFQGKPDGGGGGSAAALFLALLMLIGMLNIYAVQARVSLSLDSSARKLGMYAYTAGEEKGTLTDAACQAYAAGRLKMPRGCGNLRFEGDTWDGSRIKLKIRYDIVCRWDFLRRRRYRFIIRQRYMPGWVIREICRKDRERKRQKRWFSLRRIRVFITQTGTVRIYS